MGKTILVTGAAGFIGSHLTEALLARGDTVIGIDNLNDYYSVERKWANLAEIEHLISDDKRFAFVRGDIRDRDLVFDLFAKHSFDAVVHLAAMVGVRVSTEEPILYYDVNLNGTLALLDASVGRVSPKALPSSSDIRLCHHFLRLWQHSDDSLYRDRLM